MLKRSKNMKTQKFEKAAEDAVIKCFQSIPFLMIIEIDIELDFAHFKLNNRLFLQEKREQP